MKAQNNDAKRAVRVRLLTGAIFLMFGIGLLLVMPFEQFEPARNGEDWLSAGVWFVLAAIWVAILVQNLRTGQREAGLLSGGAVLIFAGFGVRGLAAFLPVDQHTMLRVIIAMLLVGAIGLISAYMVRQALQTRHRA